MDKIKIALLDANFVYLNALADYLSSQGEFEVVAEGTDVAGLMESMEGESPDILIADCGFLEGNDHMGLLAPFVENPDMRLLIMGFDMPEKWLRERQDDAPVSFMSKDCDSWNLANRLVYIGSYCGSQQRRSL